MSGFAGATIINPGGRSCLMISRKVGAILVDVASLAYVSYRMVSVVQSFSVSNLMVYTCELSLLALVCVEATLLASRMPIRARKQEESVLLESAQNVLFAQEKTNAIAHAKTSREIAHRHFASTDISLSARYSAATHDVIVFTEEATCEQLRRCFLSLRLMEDLDHVYVIDNSLSADRAELAQEFGFHILKSFHHLVATTEKILVCRGTDILYPDSCALGSTYDIDDSTYLELRSVYSDERALGGNVVIEVSDKRQLIREALSTRALATWSTGPALVSANAINESASITNAVSFFRACEVNGVHGLITQEIMSEEISVEPTISEIEWRALDFSYTTGAWRHSYKRSPSFMGLLIKAWSALINISIVRRISTIFLILAFVLTPSSFSFVSSEYVLVATAMIAVALLGGYISGDNRPVFARIREFYFDVEAVMYLAYRRFIKLEDRMKDTSIVKKLPSVSFFLIVTDAALVYRVIRQYNSSNGTNVSQFLRYVSLVAGYALLVSLLIGLGMVMMRQMRSAMRREISRGANINSEPVSMVDLSPGGVGCLSVLPLEVGSNIQFESSLPTKTESIRFRCGGGLCAHRQTGMTHIEWELSFWTWIKPKKISLKRIAQLSILILRLVRLRKVNA